MDAVRQAPRPRAETGLCGVLLNRRAHFATPCVVAFSASSALKYVAHFRFCVEVDSDSKPAAVTAVCAARKFVSALFMLYLYGTHFSIAITSRHKSYGTPRHVVVMRGYRRLNSFQPLPLARARS